MSRLTTVIPVFNGERFLLPTLKSVAEQSRRPDRLVVLDNCSTDGTKKIVDDFRDFPCEWRQNEKNLGLFGNMNQALSYASETDYLHILTADDLILPRFYEEMLASLAEAPPISLSFSRFDLIDTEGNLLPPWWFMDCGNESGMARSIPLRMFLDNHAEMRNILLPAVVLKTKHRAPPCRFRPEFPQHGDVVFFAEWGTAGGQLLEVPRVLCRYRVHDQNETRQNEKKVVEMAVNEWRAMRMVEQLGKRSRIFSWLRRQKLRFLFAARQHVNMRKMKADIPETRVRISGILNNDIRMFHWLAGAVAVMLRDWCHRLCGKHTT